MTKRAILAIVLLGLAVLAEVWRHSLGWNGGHETLAVTLFWVVVVGLGGALVTAASGRLRRRSELLVFVAAVAFAVFWIADTVLMTSALDAAAHS